MAAEILKKNLNDQIKERMKLLIDPEQLWADAKKNAILSAFQPEIIERLVLNHLAPARNPFDIGVIFVKISRIYERYYRKLMKELDKP